MPGSVLVCARPLPNPHWHTSKFFEFSGSGYHKCGGDTGSLSPGTNSDLVTEAPLCSRFTTLAVPEFQWDGL